jgi:nicotinate-nucleotide adenylyltransferase
LAGNSDQAPVGILGGTFDPIHDGHLRPALEVLEALKLAQIRFIPCRRPPHRSPPAATAARRLAMLKLAVTGQRGFVVDDRELRRSGPSYMVDTLTSLRTELGTVPLCLLLGADAFHGLPQWHRWRNLLALTHLVVLHRPGVGLEFSEPLRELISRHRVTNIAALNRRSAGGLWFQSVTQLDISATRIRSLLREERSVRYLLPESVRTYIREQGLYRACPLNPCQR